ncbi:transcriptional Coactivator p15-domain-containing protein [Hyaloraphidium curvatum]|nr:transcriptional Coactivator p15-domain-containing protein [Hyaloraphidium curvatum]
MAPKIPPKRAKAESPEPDDEDPEADEAPPPKKARAKSESAEPKPGSATPTPKKDADGAYFSLGDRKRLSVRRYKGTLLFDIREYYQDKASGNEMPGKKGISLTEAQFHALVAATGAAVEAAKEV